MNVSCDNDNYYRSDEIFMHDWLKGMKKVYEHKQKKKKY